MTGNLRFFTALMPVLLILAAPVFAFESGTASWYGGKFQGRQTASGEIFDTNKLTAAHKTLPFNTMVKVTNTVNSRTVTVRINDRGPFVEGRIIDLSRAAAERIDMTASGVAPVSIEIVSLPDGVAETELVKSENVNQEGIPESYKIQIASFSRPDNAQKCLRKIKSSGLPAVLEVSSSGMIRVIIPDVEENELEAMKSRLYGLGFNSPLIRHN